MSVAGTMSDSEASVVASGAGSLSDWNESDADRVEVDETGESEGDDGSSDSSHEAEKLLRLHPSRKQWCGLVSARLPK